MGLRHLKLQDLSFKSPMGVNSSLVNDGLTN